MSLSRENRQFYREIERQTGEVLTKKSPCLEIIRVRTPSLPLWSDIRNGARQKDQKTDHED
jgi:hypothetical protein